MGEIYTVIMAGGSGTRFWPQSRRARPKQLLALAGDGATALLTATARRVASLSPLSRTLVVTRADLAEGTRSALPGLPEDNLLLEPAGRNTAPCVAWATATVQRRDPAAIIVVLAADAFIRDEEAFVEALRRASMAAAQGVVVTLGIEPTRPETGYGYLQVGDSFGPVAGVKRVRAFVEKPDITKATEFVTGGAHLWNAGIFVFRADVMRAAVARCLPTLAGATEVFDAAATRGEEPEAVRSLYPSLTSVSLDTGVMEKLNEVAVVPVNCGWSDVGSWQASWELGARDADDNVVRADSAVLIDARGNMVVAQSGKTVALIGVSGLVVVDTPDALLVVPRDRAQDVKQAVDALGAKKRDDVL